MAKQQKTKQPTTTKYRVKDNFHGYINDKFFDYKKNDIAELTPFEYEVYSRFVEEMK